jgi:hypothetical protein
LAVAQSPPLGSEHETREPHFGKERFRHCSFPPVGFTTLSITEEDTPRHSRSRSRSP